VHANVRGVAAAVVGRGGAGRVEPSRGWSVQYARYPYYNGSSSDGDGNSDSARAATCK